MIAVAEIIRSAGSLFNPYNLHQVSKYRGVMSAKKVYVASGTHKGALLFESDLARKNWQLKDLFFKGVDVHHLAFDMRAETKILACLNNSW